MESSRALIANPPSGEPDNTLKVILYIAGSSLNSLRALTNLKTLCKAYFPGRYQIEVVDIFETPLRALADKVLITPTLVKAAPAPSVRIIGDLSETQTVLLALQGIEGDE